MTTKADTLRSLADRCEAGESGREIDREISGALRLVWTTDRGWMVSATTPLDWYPKHGGWTTSLDATEALRQRVLPGWLPWQLSYNGDGTVSFELIETPSAATEGSTAPTEPLVRLAAILRAMAAEIEETARG